MVQGQIAFENGKIMQGRSLGATGKSVGWLMPYTGMTDYQSVFCDPATQDQIVCMSYPLIGNVGRVEDPDLQTIMAAGLILRESIPDVDHWQSHENLKDWLQAQKKVAIAGVDTREIIRMLRREGAQRAVISTEDESPESLVKEAKAFVASETLPSQAAAKVYPAQGTPKRKIAALDLGLAMPLIRPLQTRGCEVTVFPASTPAKKLLDDAFDAVLLSSGPETAALQHEKALTPLLRKVCQSKPVWAVDAGHLLLAKSFGLELAAMPLGHHGSNYPVKDLRHGRTFMTQQHHRWVVDETSLSGQSFCQVTHENINDRSVEGLAYEGGHRSWQFLPENGNQAHQTGYLWDELLLNLAR